MRCGRKERRKASKGCKFIIIGNAKLTFWAVVFRSFFFFFILHLLNAQTLTKWLIVHLRKSKRSTSFHQGRTMRWSVKDKRPFMSNVSSSLSLYIHIVIHPSDQNIYFIWWCCFGRQYLLSTWNSEVDRSVAFFFFCIFILFYFIFL